MNGYVSSSLLWRYNYPDGLFSKVKVVAYQHVWKSVHGYVIISHTCIKFNCLARPDLQPARSFLLVMGPWWRFFIRSLPWQKPPGTERSYPGWHSIHRLLSHFSQKVLHAEKQHKHINWSDITTNMSKQIKPWFSVGYIYLHMSQIQRRFSQTAMGHGYGWIIYHYFVWMWLFIDALKSMLVLLITVGQRGSYWGC